MNTIHLTPFLRTACVLFCFLTGSTRAIDIAPMTWQANPLRSDWINVKSCSTLTGGPNAAGNGTTDDTSAIQSALTFLSKQGLYGSYSTLYFPAGTYKVSQTLKISGHAISLVGCGVNTTISWAGATGGAMIHPTYVEWARYIGLVWEGNNIAGCAYFDQNPDNAYETDTRHENEGFKDFTQPGTFVTDPAPSPNPWQGMYPVPAGGIVSGFYTDYINGSPTGQPTGEVRIYNCRFSNCTTAVYDGYQIYNDDVWQLDNCEFDNNGTGIDFYEAEGLQVTNCHFQNSTVADVVGGRGLHVKHCTSSGSNIFYETTGGVFENTIQDCYIDGWKNTAGAVLLGRFEQEMVFDCTFTHPPTGALGPIDLAQNNTFLLLSNNYAPDFPPGAGIVNFANQPQELDIVPSGARSGTLTSASQTFLHTTYPSDATTIIDVTKAPYNADRTGKAECSAKIQAAINKGISNNNGSLVYIPSGYYFIQHPLTASGSNYSIQGAGYDSQLAWFGASNNSILTITSPQNVKVSRLQMFCVRNVPSDGSQYYISSLPTCDPTTVASLTETGSSSGSSILDDLYYRSCYATNPEADANLNQGLGLVLTSLPSSAQVYIPYLMMPLTAKNSGPAQIFSRFLTNTINVSGAAPQTGFLGGNLYEGGQGVAGAYNIVVNDNQDLVLGGYYCGGCTNDLQLLAGAGTTPGRVTIDGLLCHAGGTNVQIQGYTGRLFYDQMMDNWGGQSYVPPVIQQTGSSPIDIIFSDTWWNANPAFSLNSGGNLICAHDAVNFLYSNPNWAQFSDIPNPLTPANYVSIARGLDHLRQLESVDLAMEDGVQQMVLNPSAELDAPNPSPSTTIGYTPASWNVGNALASGSGVRNFTVVPGASPFAAGAQSMLWIDSTGSGIGSTLNVYQSFASSPANEGAIFNIDFQCGTNASNSDLWVRPYGSWGNACQLHITSNRGWMNISAGVNGGDTFLQTFPAGVWYRAQIVLGAPSVGKSTAVLYVTPWSGDGPGTTVSFNIDGIPAVESSGFAGVSFATGAGVGAPQYVQIANVGLTSNAVLTVPPATGDDPGLVAHWKLDEANGPSSFDSSGNNATGTWKDSPVSSTDVPSLIKFPDPNSIDLDGNSQYVSVENLCSLPSGYSPRTICGWAKAENTQGGWRWIAAYGSPNVSQAMFIGMNGTTLDGGAYGDDLQVPNFWDNYWHFIALTYDGTTARLYADGVLKASAPKSWNLVPSACYIGEQVNNQAEFWDGEINDVRIYNQALSPTQISNLSAGNHDLNGP